MTKGFIAEGASFWYAIMGLYIVYIGYLAGPTTTGDFSIIFGLIYLAMTFVAWRYPAVGNIIAMALSVVIVYLLLNGNLESSGVGASALVLALIALFFGFSAFRARKSPATTM